MQAQDKITDTPKWLWLYFPLFMWALPLLWMSTWFFTKNFDTKLFRKTILLEDGLIENITVLSLLIAVVLALLIIKHLLFDIELKLDHKLQQLPHKQIIALSSLIALGSFYFAGEEISWGQQWFQWATPENWQDINVQAETNLHNLGGKYYHLFNSFPRFILTWAAMLGGIAAPVIMKWRKITFSVNSMLYWFIPTYTCMPTAIITAFATKPIKIIRSINPEVPRIFLVTVQESKECFLAIFIMLFMVSIYTRVLFISSHADKS